MGKIFYIADLHEGHENCMRFDNRPFTDLNQQKIALINNWNRVVTNEDQVYILGDESWYKPNSEEYQNFFEQLKGSKILVRGNHTAKITAFSRDIQRRCGFIKIVDYEELNDNGRQVILSHYPILAFKNSYYEAYHLYGHVHSSYEWHMMENHKMRIRELYSKPFNAYNVGCMMDYMSYTPKTLDEIIEASKT